MAAAASRNDKLKEELESARRTVSPGGALSTDLPISNSLPPFAPARQGALRRDRGGSWRLGVSALSEASPQECRPPQAAPSVEREPSK